MPAAHTDKFLKAEGRWSGTIGSGGVASSSTTTIPLASATGLPTDTAVVLAVGRVDSNGTDITDLGKFEVFKGVVSGNNINCGIAGNRGLEGTAQSHAAGEVVEYLATETIWNSLIAGLLIEHNQDGTHNIAGVVKTTTAQSIAGIKTFTDVPLLPNNTIETADIQDLAVTTAKIADAGATARKIRPTISQATLGADVTVTGTSYGDVAGLSISLTLDVSSNVLVMLSGNVRNDGLNSTYFKLVRASTDLTVKEFREPAASYQFPFSVQFVDLALAAGTYTFKVQAKIDAGTTTIGGGAAGGQNTSLIGMVFAA